MDTRKALLLFTVAMVFSIAAMVIALSANLGTT